MNININVILFIASSVILAWDYGLAGIRDLGLVGDIDREDEDTRNFVIGKACILLITAASNLVWIVAIGLATLTAINNSYPELFWGAFTALNTVLSVTAVVNRRKWWRRIERAAGEADN